MTRLLVREQCHPPLVYGLQQGKPSLPLSTKWYFLVSTDRRKTWGSGRVKANVKNKWKIILLLRASSALPLSCPSVVFPKQCPCHCSQIFQACFCLENFVMKSLSIIQFLLHLAVIHDLYSSSEFKISVKDSALGRSWAAAQRLR